MLSCREVTRLIASDQLANSGWRTRLAVRIHLAMCEHCHRFRDQLRAIGLAATRLGTGPGEDAAVIQRVLDRIALDRETTGNKEHG
jgi:anti-sigma factor ChrR (cupin superfamily)